MIKSTARNAEKAVKTTAKGTVKTTEKGIKTAQATSKAAIKTTETSVKTAQAAKASAKTAPKGITGGKKPPQRQPPKPQKRQSEQP